MRDATREIAVAPPPHETPSIALAPPAVGAERRQLTVMVCGSIAATRAESSDPEDVRDRNCRVSSQDYCIGRAISKGYAAQFLGDGIHIYFGYPIVAQDDAEHAVRAALAVKAAFGTEASSTVL